MPQTPGAADHAAPPNRGVIVAHFRKAIVAGLGLVAQIAASGVLDGPADEGARLWVQAILAVAAAVGVYVVPNKPQSVTGGHP